MLIACLLAALGAALGSFAALLADRLPRGEAVVLARSRCRSCHTPLRARDLVPVLSFMALRGRCAACHAPIPATLFHAEITGAGFGVLAWLAAPDAARALLLLSWMVTLLALAMADLRWFRLPDPLVLLAGVLGLALALAGDGSGWPPLIDRATWALIGAVAGGGMFWLIRVTYRWRRGRDGMGLGDVKLMAALGLALGPDRLPIMALLAASTALALALLRAWRKGRALSRIGRVPFGAALSLSSIAVLLLT